MKALSSVSFLLITTTVFLLISSTAIVEATSNSTQTYKKKLFCVPVDDASDADLQLALDWACHQPIDCGPIQPGAVCGDPPTVRSRAAFAMNSYYRSQGGLPSSCDFSGTATVTCKDPSYGNCKYL
ncbi:major pollen allergen Ole e 10-like [Hibiscus syriacus]|uniref:major pollen allergen Ole e 10-like n=1 Tax=Hibiscus syriacus TaxID=106335 RepID=UPI0019213932|nr:major pollen allergen Ole e 10-like [Hibiscus syriacus]